MDRSKRGNTALIILTIGLLVSATLFAFSLCSSAHNVGRLQVLGFLGLTLNMGFALLMFLKKAPALRVTSGSDSAAHETADCKTTEEILIRNQKLETLGIRAGGLAHDFNNLLSIILGNCELGMRETLPESKVHRHLEHVRTTGNMAADLCKQMMSGNALSPLKTRPLSLNDALKEILDLLKVSIPTNAEIKCDLLSPNLPQIEADPTQLGQVLMNLILNASESLQGKEGRLMFTTSVVRAEQSFLKRGMSQKELPAGEYVCLEINDTGCGMDAPTLEKIFEPFFTTKSAGRGLGLAAALGIVQAHRGTIFVESKPKRGSTFQVYLPPSSRTVPEATQFSPAAADKIDPAPVSAVTVLIIEDEECVLRMVTEMVQSFGFGTMTAPNGIEGLKLYQANSRTINLVLLDMTMPRMNGNETCKEILKVRPEARVLLMSGYTEEQLTLNFEIKGFAGTIQKPFMLKALREKINQSLVSN